MTAYNIVNPTALASGQPEDITVVLSNFQALAAVINGNLDDGNIKAGAGLAISKLQNYPANSGLYLRGDSTWGPIGAHTQSSPSGTNVDLPWNGGGAHSLVDDLNPSGVPTIRSYGAPPAGDGTRLIFRMGAPVTILSNVTTGSGRPFYTATPGNPTTIGAPGVVQQIEFMYFVGYWIEVNRDVPMPYAITLPPNPGDGQEAILVDSTSNPSYQWWFRYNAGSTSAYKWEFVGGAPVVASNLNGETFICDNLWRDTATVGPSIIVPRAGEYFASGSASITSSVAGSACYLGICLGASNPSYYSFTYAGVANAYGGAPIAGSVYPVAAGGELRLRQAGSNGTGSVITRYLTVVPKRVA
jgi:hypothetical protein